MFNNANEYVLKLGVGVNSDACKTRPARKAYTKNPILYSKFYAKGFRHIRLRIVNDVTFEQYDDKGNLVGGRQLLSEIDTAIQNSLAAGLLPVVAYGSGLLEEVVTDENEQKLYNWWHMVGDLIAKYDNRVSMNLIIEIGNPLAGYTEIVNRVYSTLLSYFRAIPEHANRIIFCAPVKLSDPDNLKYLTLPNDDPFLAVEIHDYAAGPTKTATSPKYWNESDPDPVVRENNKQRIRDTLKTATDWRTAHGIPLWFGAILPAPYNKDGGVYTVPEQVEFVHFFTNELVINEIPVAWNSDDKFIDLTTTNWIVEQAPVIKELFFGQIV